MDWSIIISVIVGGLFTLAGGALQSYLADKKRKEDNKIRMKISVLEDLIGNRVALVAESDQQIEAYKAPFFSALNRINVAYYDSNKVLDKHDEWKNAMISSQPVTNDRKNELFHELIVEMHEDLDMRSPTLEQFKATLH